MADPVKYRTVYYSPEFLELGYRADHVAFGWCPYAERSADARADYDRLVLSLYHHGMKQPIITYKGHVLIGQRRVEIMRRLYPREPIKCAEVTEDVSKWDRHDIKRIEAMKDQVGSGRFEY